MAETSEGICPPNRKRKSYGPKVRTGCITCKQRCLKWGGRCDGYEIDAPRTKPVTTVAKRILPKLPNVKPLCRSPDTSLFSNDLEYQAFQEYSHHTARHLTGFRETEIWGHVVLQASETDPALRHAVTAIGALNLQDSVENSNDKARLEFAYREYDMAIVGLRKATTEGRADIRTKLIACIVFSCLEAYLGNNEMASGQAYQAIELMEQYTKYRLQGQAQTRPPPLDTEIVEMLMLFEIQFPTYYDGRGEEKYRERRQRFGITVDHIPKEFTNLKQASSMLSRIMLWGIYVRFTRDGDNFAPPLIFNEKLPPVLGLRHSTTDYIALAKALNKYKEWEVAFEPLRTKARRVPGTKLFNGVALLQLHCQACYLWMATGAPDRSMYYRKYTKQLRETVALAKIVNAQQVEGSFSLDFRTVLPLMVVSFMYRHIGVRRDIIQLFLDSPRREGLWDSVLLARIMKWRASIEEEGLDEDEEYVPEDRIADIVLVEQNAATKCAYVVCRQGGEGGASHEITLYF
ncbi:uncharacterized protein PAC_11232 [Phialocephala subalpina]|uniref:Zn(2)-C6 fungal-type domain-containing protein n=1 Tax=Phialocephala subalpina TaxID=576137 RepID=A0A1L7X8L6_9HELO|nr:uncharacterized protein PAC_11232 [Phialocephala subalpina]